MSAIGSAAFTLAVILYSAASTLFFLDLVRPAARVSAFGPRVLLAGGVLHAAHVVIASLLLGVCPVESLPFALSFCALMAVSAYGLVRRRFRVDALGALVGPLALTFLIGAEFVEGRSLGTPGASPLLILHIAANVLGVGLFLLAGAAGAFYVMQERRLKARRFAFGARLPPLASLDRATHRLLLAGFPLLTFGVVSGSLFVGHMSFASGSDLLRALLGYASWLVLGLVLLSRRLVGWTGRRAAYGTLAGVGCVLLVIVFYVARVPAG
ncbi:MAG: cytochrome c biogenesis protein CcsA [Pseudomonadota bacterium]|nr:MAG: hypothetical protein DIU78_01720 [Pseudomonadota bacterium]